ncbi:MAG: phosphatase PAP2 family protein [Novosphingobium sp.]
MNELSSIYPTDGAILRPLGPPRRVPAARALLLPEQVSRLPAAWLIYAVGASAVVVAAMMAQARLILVPNTLGFAAAVAVLLPLALARFWLRKPLSLRQRQLGAFCEDTLVFVATALLGVLASYPAAAATSGFADPALAHIDRLLHFDWLAWYGFVARHPVLQHAGAVAYGAIYATPLLMLGYFAVHGRRCDARRFLGTFWLAVVLTLALFPLFPAAGPLAYLWHGPIPYMPTSALYQEQLIPALRARQMIDIDLGALRGLVCAPSFHAASAGVFIAAAWPVPRLRWTLVPVNVAMLLATPVEGTHYLTDIIAGGLVAVAAILVVNVVLPARSRTAA